MREKLTIPTMWLIQQLNDIGKHLRECSKDIISFSRFFADQLDWFEEATMKPWDFVREWNKAMIQIARIRYGFNPQGNSDSHLLKHMSLDRFQSLVRMMPVFAEDLCGKEFAEVVAMCKEDGIGVIYLNDKFASNASESNLPEDAVYWFDKAIEGPVL